MFSIQSNNCTPFVHIFDIIFLFVAELEESKLGISGKGLTQSNQANLQGNCYTLTDFRNASLFSSDISLRWFHTDQSIHLVTDSD